MSLLSINEENFIYNPCFFNDFAYDKDIEMFDERYRFCKNEIWNFNRKILKELQKANKKMEKSFGANNELRKELRKEANLRIKEINSFMSNSFGFGGTNAALIFEKV